MTDPWGVVGPGFPDSVVNVFQAGNTLINASGLFVYSGAPGPANPPVLSVTSPGVTQDPFGQAVLPGGLAIYGPSGQDIFLGISPATGHSVLEYLSGAAIEGSAAFLVSAVSGAGAGQFIEVVLEGPALNVVGVRDSMVLQMASSNQGGTTLAEAIFTYLSDAQVSSAILNVNNLGLGLFNTAAPAAVIGRAGLFASAGNLDFISGSDGNKYATGRLTLPAAGQLISATGLTALTGLSATLQPGTYEIHAEIKYTGNQAGGAPVAQLIGTAGVGAFSFTYIINGASPVYTSQAFSASVNGPALTSGGKGNLIIDGVVVIAVGVVINVSMATTVAADTFSVLSSSYLRVCPV